MPATTSQTLRRSRLPAARSAARAWVGLVVFFAVAGAYAMGLGLTAEQALTALDPAGDPGGGPAGMHP